MPKTARKKVKRELNGFWPRDFEVPRRFPYFFFPGSFVLFLAFSGFSGHVQAGLGKGICMTSKISVLLVAQRRQACGDIVYSTLDPKRPDNLVRPELGFWCYAARRPRRRAATLRCVSSPKKQGWPSQRFRVSAKTMVIFRTCVSRLSTRFATISASASVI